jgi:hypothetical protein
MFSAVPPEADIAFDAPCRMGQINLAKKDVLMGIPENEPRPGLSCAVTRICIVLEPKSERSTSLCTRPYVDDKCAVLSPTTRRSILLIRSERSTSAALIAAIVSRNVLTFDPSDTIPPITTAIDPMAVT